MRIALLGDFDRDTRSHWATEAALYHAGARLGLTVEPRWIPTPDLADTVDAPQVLAGFAGVWGAPGGPFDRPTGMVNGIEHARRMRVPYLGTCAGFQYALIELSRNVLGLEDADTAENGPASANVVITPVGCPLRAAAPGRPPCPGLSAYAWPPGLASLPCIRPGIYRRSTSATTRRTRRSSRAGRPPPGCVSPRAGPAVRCEPSSSPTTRSSSRPSFSRSFRREARARIPSSRDSSG